MQDRFHGSRGPENHTRLTGCKSPHAFVCENPLQVRSNPLYRCKTCGGTATTSQVEFFLDGVIAGKASVTGEGGVCQHVFQRPLNTPPGEKVLYPCKHAGCDVRVSSAQRQFWRSGHAVGRKRAEDAMSELVSKRTERGFVRVQLADGGSARCEPVDGELAQHLRAEMAAWLRDDPPADELPPPFRAWLAAFCADAGANERGA